MTRYKHITAAGNVCEDVLAIPLEAAIHGYACAPRGQVLQIGTWDDRTTPRTAHPPQFFRTGPCPASHYGIVAIIVRREA